MLADESEHRAPGGTLHTGLHRPGEWLSSLIGFIATNLPRWRDDPSRPAETAETRLTAQLCSRLNGASHHSGWDFLQFKQEEPDETAGGRSIDLAAAPRGTTIWIEGREYSEYQTLLPIECKRLPTPAAADRDTREYLFSRFSSTGGVDRFKRGHHGASHLRAAMVGYIQDQGVTHWWPQVDTWITDLAKSGAAGWSAADKLALVLHDAAARAAHLRSQHPRTAGLDPIAIDHLWIEM